MSHISDIWLVHHTHVDIGYTEPQDVIMRRHAEFVAQALDHCAATDALAEGERFCWTCEVAWTVKVFLARYPERAEEFFRRVREGRIEVTALYMQLTELFTAEMLEETTGYALELGRRHGFEVVTAMNSDVNGWSWGLPDLLARQGVRYFDTAINETRSLGVRPRPALFRWRGPNGGALLFGHTDGYLKGNSLRLGQEGGAARVVGYVRQLEDNGYPFHIIELRIQGASHDNAPPGLWLCRTVHDWNQSHPEGPRLRLVTPRQWFAAAAADWPEPLVEHKAGWPDWWSDGLGSAMRESAYARRAQADLATLDALAAATGETAPAGRRERASDAAALFCEHTWGAWCSTDDPDCLTSVSQWNAKAGFACTAAVEAQSLVRDTLAAAVRPRDDGAPGIVVFNPLSHSRSDLVELLVADEDAGFAPLSCMRPVRDAPGPAFHLVDEESGAAIPLRREPAIADSARRAAQKIGFVARDVPARGFRRYRLVAGECAAPVAGAGLAVETGPRGIAAIGESRFDGGSRFLGEVIYETIPGPFGREKLSGWGYTRRDAPLKRRAIKFAPATLTPTPYGSVWRLEARTFSGSLRALALEVTVYDGLPYVDICYRVDKVPEREAEAIYVAFPGVTKDAGTTRGGSSTACVTLDIPGALLRPGIDQVPGTATDWHCLQHYFAIERCGVTLVVASPDIPLVQINGINTGKWQQSLPPHNGLVMSWVMNNYWFTNFPAAQGGIFSWRYRLQLLPGAFDSNAATRCARALAQPLVAGLQRTL